MKTTTLALTLSAGLILATIPNARAISAQPLPTVVESSGAAAPFEMVRWEEVKVEKLRHAYYLLEHTDHEYAGHRLEAMHSIKKAAEILGVDLVGWHEPHEESRWESDRRVHEARTILESLQDETHGREQEHVHNAVKQLDKALGK